MVELDPVFAEWTLSAHWVLPVRLLHLSSQYLYGGAQLAGGAIFASSFEAGREGFV